MAIGLSVIVYFGCLLILGEFTKQEVVAMGDLKGRIQSGDV